MGARSGRPRASSQTRRVFWDSVRAGLTLTEAAAVAGVSSSAGQGWFSERGGVMPRSGTVRTRHLSFAEREEIALLRAAGLGVRAIARELGRDPATISRELRRVQHHSRPRTGIASAYKASTAQADADRLARRPKPAKLATHLALRRRCRIG